MDYETFFKERLDELHTERRYRVFIDLDRDAVRFPTAVWRPNSSREPREVTIWCLSPHRAPRLRDSAVSRRPPAAARVHP
jgi:5-aminolevulinate synthase